MSGLSAEELTAIRTRADAVITRNTPSDDAWEHELEQLTLVDVPRLLDALTAQKQSADEPAERLAAAGFKIAGAWNFGDGRGWFTRIESMLDADHDTYCTGCGLTLGEALEACWAWWESVDV